MPLTYYDVLGVSETASTHEIRSRFRQLARRLHPDALRRASAAERLRAEEEFKEIADAYRVLSHPELRTHYDAQLHQFRTPPAPRPDPALAWTPPPAPAAGPAPRRKHRLGWSGGLGYMLYLLLSGHMCSQPPPAPTAPTPAPAAQPAQPSPAAAVRWPSRPH